MPQVVVRIDPRLAEAIDRLVESGKVESRSAAVRQGLHKLIDDHRRTEIGEAIVRGYEAHPQTEDEVGWADEATARMITDEPW